ncbi:MAG: hypothetical protein IBX50_04140 [Marinospirillum sp.]|uniref:hypothetical protein n=1 Tax=Marinospirillum sp. TaxID=2183934 RepID=UPI0019F2D729|nr:hypothetical protein [Marinospirillum sp.]MBE0505896.1 hypothetical protein [Marinospirillum sp.]
MEPKKIIGVSLMSRDRVAVSAAYDGSVLVIGKAHKLDGNLLTWRKNAAEFVREQVAAGAAVFVEELSDHVAQHAHGVLLQDAHPEDGRPLLAVALDNYNALFNSGALVFAKGTESGQIMESAIDMQSDDRGRNTYRVDWARVKGIHRAVLLCCLATEGMQAMTDGYFEEMFGGLDAPDGGGVNPLASFARAMHDWDADREKEMQVREGRIKL